LDTTEIAAAKLQSRSRRYPEAVSRRAALSHWCAAHRSRPEHRRRRGDEARIFGAGRRTSAKKEWVSSSKCTP